MSQQLVFAVLAMFMWRFTFGDKQGCISPQYLEIGKSGNISCSFNDGFYSIHWYYNLDVTEGPPTLSYERQQVAGEGYESGKFNINMDGSLIINNVSVQHETLFTAYEFETEQTLPKKHDVEIITIVRPAPPYAIVDDCVGNRDTCYIQWRPQMAVVCRIKQARPGMPLSWVVRTPEGDVQLTNMTVYTNQTNTWSTSLSLTDPFIYSSYIALLLCKPNDPFDLLTKRESKVLIHNKQNYIPPLETKEVSIELNNRVVLPCTDSEYQLLVWEQTVGNTSTVIIFDVLSTGESYIVSSNYDLQEGNMIIHNTKSNQEGLYSCTYSDFMTEAVRSFYLVIYVTPIPGYPIIEGCNNERYCVLEANYNGILTCSVKGIRPAVELGWRAYHQDSSISFQNEQLHTRSNGDTSDISITTEYIAEETAGRRITLECRAVGPNSKYFSLSSKVDLLFPEFNEQHTTKEAAPVNNTIKPTINKTTLAVVVVIVIAMVIAVIGAVSFYKVYKRGTSTTVNEENVPMIQMKGSNFISQLKSTYQNAYNSLRPIPFLRERWGVNEWYVDGGVEYLSKGKRKEGRWKSLDSYKNIFTHKEITSNRWFVEGDPGYGKSTLSLQLAYEWCNRVEGSFMCSVDTFVLLKLRQLKGVSSIYEAIKLFILPKDSKLSVEEIRDYIDNSSLVLILLDGFDEYPDREQSDRHSDIFNVIERKMLPEANVLLTTRSSLLPRDYAPQTNRLRLTGFNIDAQKRYLQKVNGFKSTENTIEEWLRGNPILKDLFEVPLFFAMYAHLSLESDALKSCTSVTGFFRYMITCLHSHMTLKFSDEKVDKFAFDENNHHKLDRFCFESLNDHSYNPDTTKDSLTKKIGKLALYRYLKIGILIEEERVVFSNEPEIQASEHVKTASYVRFYHSLFCEWYAAHHIANVLDKIEEHNKEDSLKILEDIDPTQLQYVYRFACGLKHKAAKHILEYLKKGVGNKKFALLCMYEQCENVDGIVEHVREFCSEAIHIRDHDTRITQKSVIKLLEIAASEKLRIPKLVLSECFKSVNLSSREIVLISDVRIPHQFDFERLSIEQTGTELGQDEIADVFQFITECRTIQEISFVYSLLPFSFTQGTLLEQLQTKGIQVLWYLSEERYFLDLTSGKWQKGSSFSELTKLEYKKVVKFFRMMNK
ncbi:uncharacterized protein [Apostichopus japonicus]|uniref:uncharacterized protein n=1 Tax=Stichopus japonicus TaxID=307972 RepID=UPI003AB19829